MGIITANACDDTPAIAPRTLPIVQTLQLCPPEILSAVEETRSALVDSAAIETPALAAATEAAQLIGTLSADTQLALAVLALAAIDHGTAKTESLTRILGPDAMRIATQLSRLGEFGLPHGWSVTQGLDARQAESVRKMLLAVVSDSRLVLARLAIELVHLRHAAALAPPDRERAATAARAVFAPLASRLGVWQMKWELEDLAFRYLEPEAYRRIAAALNEKRADRERYIESFCERLRADLAAAGIDAEVYGRPKHLYSIYRKMQTKHLAFGELYDIRAVRIVVESVSECYAALGVVHGLWNYIPQEFDDYIATPKANQYRSIHTAIAGPEGATVEVQIRTREMHEHAELGFAAHWQYKEGGARNRGYERKIEAVRRLLAPSETDDAARDFLEGLRAQLFADRVYVLTPKGEVVELPRGATPLDFAYHVHSDLGHRCRGAKVNGRIVPLTQTLSNGEVVEIIAGKHPAPSRDWLSPELGYLASTRSRAKVRAWFRQQNSGDNRTAGRSILERELTRAGTGPDLLMPLVQALDARNVDDLYRLIGEGTITATQLGQAIVRLVPRPGPPIRRRPKTRAPRHHSPVEIEGVDDLPITLAGCCAPVRPQPIVGYVTVGRGVTVHLQSCPSLARMQARRPQRVLAARWTADDEHLASVELAVAAYDRHGLVRDLTDLIALEHLSIEALHTTTEPDEGTAHVTVRLAIRDVAQLARLTRRFKSVANVLTVERRR